MHGGELAGRSGQLVSVSALERACKARQWSGADRWTAVASDQLAGIGADRRKAPGVAEDAVTVPWVEWRIWGHWTSRSRQKEGPFVRSTEGVFGH